MRAFVLAWRLASVGFAFLIATGIPAMAQDRRCLSIADVNERIDCLESGGANSNAETSFRQNARPPKETIVGPSFDCRAAASSIERAICSDPTLSEWDYRMGQQYQAALRARKDGSTQSVLESQRAWLIQRNLRCSSIADTAIWNCLLEMTKQRADTLAKVGTGAENGAMAQLPTSVQIPKSQSVQATKAPSTDVSTQLAPGPLKSDAASSAVSEGSNSFLITIFVIAALVGGITIIGNISRRERLARERQRLVLKYGDEITDRIIAHQVWQGMTDEQLIDSWGAPVDVSREITRTKVKETWKYGQTGKNRFSQRVSLEDGIVVGWKS